MENSETEKRVYKLVLTGGPCGGKTTGQARLCTFFESLGWKVFRVPETATVLLSGGIKFSDLNTTQDNFTMGVRQTRLRKLGRWEAVACQIGNEAYKFQENLLRTMIQIENTFFELGESCSRNCLIICDRGAMDASAFISKDKWDKMMRNNDWNNVELRDNRYNQIIHMVSAANGAEQFYSTEEHACRSEGVELARELDYNAAAAWVGHPYFDVIDNSTEFEDKIRRMIECVCMKLGLDTGDRLLKSSRKRKFLVKGPMPRKTEFPTFQDFDVVHNYLQSNSPNQVRLRKRGQKGTNLRDSTSVAESAWTLAAKIREVRGRQFARLCCNLTESGRALPANLTNLRGHFSYCHTIRRPKQFGQVVEVKTQITHRDYINLLSQRDEAHFTIYKQRRCFLINNQYFQLDVYKEPGHPRCKGMMLLETYSGMEIEALLERLPIFLTIIKEVTGNPDYSMFNLSLREDWKNSKKFCNSFQGPAIKANEDGKSNGFHINGHDLCKTNGTAKEDEKHLKPNGLIKNSIQNYQKVK